MRAYIRSILYLGVITATTLGVVGCAAGPQRPVYEQEARFAIDTENWETCKLVYSNELVPTISTHTHRKGRTHRSWEVKDDLNLNYCRFILGKYWISY